MCGVGVRGLDLGAEGDGWEWVGGNADLVHLRRVDQDGEVGGVDLEEAALDPGEYVWGGF